MSDITRKRGDSYPDQVTFKDSTGAPFNVTGASFLLTIDTQKTPPDATTKVIQIVGTITDAVNGVVEFQWTPLLADIAIGTYYYDIQMTDASTNVRTFGPWKYVFAQDITKD